MPVRCWLPLRSQLQWAFVPAYLCQTLQPSPLASQFPTWVHFSGIAMSYNITVTLISGFAPLAAAALVRGPAIPLLWPFAWPGRLRLPSCPPS